MQKEINAELFIKSLKNRIFKDCTIDLKIRKDGAIDYIRITRKYCDLKFVKELNNPEKSND